MSAKTGLLLMDVSLELRPAAIVLTATRRNAMLIQLNPPLHMETPKGPGVAHFVIDYGPETDLLWVVFMNADGASWTVPNPEVRQSFNWSVGRRRAAPAKHDDQPAARRFRPTVAAGAEA